MGKINNFSKIFKFNSFREGGRNPFVDWVMILIVSMIVVASLIFGGFYLYKRVTSGNIQSTRPPQINNTNVLNSKDLDYLVNKFNKKEELSNKIKKDSKVYPDPAI